MESWKNAKEAGLKGDGKSDDTEALRQAIEQYETIYFPQGEYVFSGQIPLKENMSYIFSAAGKIVRKTEFIQKYMFYIKHILLHS